MKKQKLPRLSETECVRCKHKFLCHSHKDWKEDIETDWQECENYQQVEDEKDSNPKQMTIFDYL